MDLQQIQKANEKEDIKRRQNVKRRDPRIDTADDISMLSDTEDSISSFKFCTFLIFRERWNNRSWYCVFYNVWWNE